MRALLLLAFLATSACGTDSGGDVLDAGSPDAMPDSGVADPCEDSPGCPKATFTCLHQKVLRDQPRCAACHDTAFNFGSFAIPADKAAAYSSATGNTAAIGAGVKTRRVVPGMPAESWLYVKLLPNPPVGTQMPQTGPLRACEISAFEAWINAGAMND